jgi:hypothetical protein
VTSRPYLIHVIPRLPPGRPANTGVPFRQLFVSSVPSAWPFKAGGALSRNLTRKEKERKKERKKERERESAKEINKERKKERKKEGKKERKKERKKYRKKERKKERERERLTGLHARPSCPYLSARCCFHYFSPVINLGPCHLGSALSLSLFPAYNYTTFLSLLMMCCTP